MSARPSRLAPNEEACRAHRAAIVEHIGRSDPIVTELAIIEYEENRWGQRTLVLRELAPGVSIAAVVEATGAPLRIPPELIHPGSTL